MITFQSLGLKMQGQFSQKLVEAACHDLRQFMEGEADAVIRHPLLREIISSDAFAPVAAADLLLAVGRQLGLLFA